jgi:DNA invertase Pin-like site-specific DNA recombinase
MTAKVQRAAVYARVSTFDQEPENQLTELRRYATARGLDVVEYVDHGISGTKETRPALDRMLKDVRRRKVDLVIVWSLDRLGRSLRHLIGLLDEVQSLGVGFVSLKEGLDCTTAAGRLQWQIIGAISEFERARLVERVRAGLERAKAQGTRLGTHLTGKRPSELEILEAKLKLEVFLAEKAAEQAASGTAVAPANRQPDPSME